MMSVYVHPRYENLFLFSRWIRRGIVCVLFSLVPSENADSQDQAPMVVHTGSRSETELLTALDDLRLSGIIPAVILSPDSVLCYLHAPTGDMAHILPSRMSVDSLGPHVPAGSLLSGTGGVSVSTGFPSEGCVVPAVEMSASSHVRRQGSMSTDIVGSSYVSNNERMTGLVVVSLFFPESDGSIDQNTYDWTNDAVSEVVGAVMRDLAFLSLKAAEHFVPLTFRLLVYDHTSPEITEQGYEPAETFCRACQPLPWVQEIAGNLGFETINDYNRQMRRVYRADWAVSGFVIHTPIVDAALGYAYPGQGYVVVGQKAFRGLFAHEASHLFGAFDEYIPGGVACDWSWNGTPNANSRQSPCLGSAPCLMDGLSSSHVCDFTAAHIGWTASPPTARPVFPGSGDVLPEGTVRFAWDKQSTDERIRSVIEVRDAQTDSVILLSEPQGGENTVSIALGEGTYYWRIISGGGYQRGYWSKVWTADLPFSVAKDLPSENVFLQNYPNPSNPGTVFAFRLAHKARVTLRLYDRLGREVAVILDQSMQPGRHSVPFQTLRLATGVYHSILRVDGVSYSGKVLVVR